MDRLLNFDIFLWIFTSFIHPVLLSLNQVQDIMKKNRNTCLKGKNK